jgi:DNA repair exonuclease SbcCD ATPase subunit
MDNELNTIAEDMTRRSKNLQKKLTEIRKEIYKEEKQFIQTLQKEREEIEEEIESLSGNLIKIRVKQWIIPSLIGISIVLGLGIGSLALGKWISSQYQEIKTLSQEIEGLKEKRKSIKNYSPIHKVYNNGIEFKKGYKASSWQGKDNGLWFTEIKKER